MLAFGQRMGSKAYFRRGSKLGSFLARCVSGGPRKAHASEAICFDPPSLKFNDLAARKLKRVPGRGCLTFVTHVDTAMVHS